MTGCLPRVVMWALLTQLPMGIYGDWLNYIPPLPFEIPAQLLTLFILPFFMGFMLTEVFYGSYLGFFWLWAFGVLVSAFVWRNTRLWWGERIISFGLLILLMAGPYVVPLMYDPYTRLVHQEYFETYLGKDSGEELNWLTEPEGALGGAIRRAQPRLDIYGCIYKLHGWSKDNRLYYDTGGAATYGLQFCSAQVWRYDPNSSSEPQLIWWLPADFESASQIVDGPPFEEKEDTPPGGGVFAWPKRIVEESTSPDGTMSAAVIQVGGVHYEVVVVEPSRE